MFPQSIRFDVRQEKEFFSVAKNKRNPFFQVRYLPSIQTRFAVVVPKKVSKSAVKRHKILRQMRAILTRQQSLFVQKKLVFIMFPSSYGKSFQELEQAVKQVSKELS